MKERRAYKGKTIEVQSLELKDGKGWDSMFFVEESDNGAVLTTQFSLPTVFQSAVAAIQAAFAAGQQKVDLGFEHKFVVEHEKISGVRQ